MDGNNYLIEQIRINSKPQNSDQRNKNILPGRNKVKKPNQSNESSGQKSPKQETLESQIDGFMILDVPADLSGNTEISQTQREKMKNFFVNSWLFQKDEKEVSLNQFTSNDIRNNKLELSDIIEETEFKSKISFIFYL